MNKYNCFKGNILSRDTKGTDSQEVRSHSFLVGIVYLFCCDTESYNVASNS